MTTLSHRFAFLDVLFAHAGRRPPVAAARASAAVVARSDLSGVGSGRVLEERRGAAMRRLFPKLHAWQAMPGDRSAALNAYLYLAEADNVDDLDQRIDRIARRPPSRNSRH